MRAAKPALHSGCCAKTGSGCQAPVNHSESAVSAGGAVLTTAAIPFPLTAPSQPAVPCTWEHTLLAATSSFTFLSSHFNDAFIGNIGVLLTEMSKFYKRIQIKMYCKLNSDLKVVL